MKPDFYIDCLEPGADNPKEHAPVPAPEPPEGFVDNTVYRYKLVDGKEVLIGTMEAFPEGWDNPTKILPQKPKKEEDNEMHKRDDKTEKLANAKKLIADGASVMGAAKQIGIPQSTLVTWLTNEKKEKPEPEPKVSPQEIDVAKEETSDGFTAKDEEPIPYVAVERDPLHYKNMHWMKRIDEYATNKELAKLKIDFANLTLLSTLNDTMKLKVIEYIVRM